MGAFGALIVLLGIVSTAVGAEAGNVARAMFTTDVVEREPVDRVLVLSNKRHRIYFFTDLRHFEGQTIIHRWVHDGKVVAAVPFEVKGPRWRVYSAEDLNSDALGKWMVIVTDSRGWPLKAAIFRYVAADGDGDNSVIVPPDAHP